MQYSILAAFIMAAGGTLAACAPSSHVLVGHSMNSRAVHSNSRRGQALRPLQRLPGVLSVPLARPRVRVAQSTMPRPERWDTPKGWRCSRLRKADSCMPRPLPGRSILLNRMGPSNPMQYSILAAFIIAAGGTLAACAPSSHVLVGQVRPPITPDQVHHLFAPAGDPL